jgi:nucleoside-diphosphate-sugar epimerase
MRSVIKGRPQLDGAARGGYTMKIVVIGGTGLIGSKTVSILRQGGHEVVAALAAKRYQQHHRRGAQGGHARRAGGDRPRQFALI